MRRRGVACRGVEIPFIRLTTYDSRHTTNDSRHTTNDARLATWNLEHKINMDEEEYRKLRNIVKKYDEDKLWRAFSARREFKVEHQEIILQEVYDRNLTEKFFRKEELLLIASKETTVSKKIANSSEPVIKDININEFVKIREPTNNELKKRVQSARKMLTENIPFMVLSDHEYLVRDEHHVTIIKIEDGYYGKCSCMDFTTRGLKNNLICKHIYYIYLKTVIKEIVKNGINQS